MEQKLIFLDIDGTLTEPGKNVPPPSAADAVRRAREKGHKVVLCSGRNYGMLFPVLQFGFDGLVASAGGIYRTIGGREHSYTDEGFKEFLAENIQSEANSELLRWRIQIENELDLGKIKAAGHPATIMVIVTNSDDLASVEASASGKLMPGDPLMRLKA